MPFPLLYCSFLWITPLSSSLLLVSMNNHISLCSNITNCFKPFHLRYLINLILFLKYFSFDLVRIIYLPECYNCNSIFIIVLFPAIAVTSIRKHWKIGSPQSETNHFKNFLRGVLWTLKLFYKHSYRLRAAISAKKIHLRCLKGFWKGSSTYKNYSLIKSWYKYVKVRKILIENIVERKSNNDYRKGEYFIRRRKICLKFTIMTTNSR